MKFSKGLLIILLIFLSLLYCITIYAYSPRIDESTDSPASSNLYYIHTSYGGLNECIPISGSSVLPNCVGYAWGRAYEMLGSRPNLCKQNAELWFDYNKNNGFYEYGTIPALGAIAVWSDGVIGNANDGAGHVAVVEEINGDTVITSESAYGGKRFFTTTRNTTHTRFSESEYYDAYDSNENKIKCGPRKFLGFIYVCGKVTSSVPSAPSNVKTEVSGSKVTVTWSIAENASSYDVYIVESPWGWENIISSTSTTALQHTFTLNKGGSFSAFVIAKNGRIQSSQSKWSPFSINSTVPEKPIINGTFPRYSTVDKSIKISWDEVANTEQYEYFLCRYPVGYAYSSNDRHGTTKKNSITFSNLPAGEYTFFLHAVNGFGRSHKSSYKTIIIDDIDYVPINTTIWNKHIYVLYDNVLEWKYAEKLSKKIGGHLVTIESSQENQVVKELIQKGNHAYYWIGMRSKDPYNNDNTFYWSNQETVSYTNWANNEPSSSGEKRSKEGFAHMYKNSGKWNDVANVCSYNIGFVVEIDMDNIKPSTEIHIGNKRYIKYDYSLTWTEANSFCNAIGGQLAVINTEEEYQALCELLDSTDDTEKTWFFVGAKRDDNKPFYWIDGSNISNVITEERRASYGLNYESTYNYMMMYKSDKKFANLANYYKVDDDMNNLGFICEIQKPYTQSEVLKNGNNYIVNTTAYNINQGDIIVSAFRNERLIGIKKQKSNQFPLTFTFEGNIDTIKVMTWKKLGSISPITKCETITFEQFITR